MTPGIVFDIKKFSIHDGPGIRTTIFFKGCPLSCWWCHNPESQALEPEMMFRKNRCIRCRACQAICEQGAISWDGDAVSTNMGKCTVCGACVEVCYAEAREMIGREMTAAQVMAEIERDIAFYDESAGGVTFSGGEPLWQRDFLADLLRGCQEKDIHTAVDTCGFATWETVDSIREHVDLFLYDLKLMDDARHQKFTAVSNQLILSNLRALAERGHNIILRVPIIPGINDDDEDIRQLGAFAATLPDVNRMALLPYHPTAVEKYRLLHRSPFHPRAFPESARSPVPGAALRQAKDSALAGGTSSVTPPGTGAESGFKGFPGDLPPYSWRGQRGGRHEIRPPSDGRMAEIAAVLNELGLQVSIGG